jgi:hypothetical protein
MKRLAHPARGLLATIAGLAAVWALSLGFLPAADHVRSERLEQTCSVFVAGPKGDGAHGDMYARPFAGFLDCVRCHNTGPEGKQKVIGPGGIEIDLDKEQWVLYREFPKWAKDDKHGQAYAVLLRPRSIEMGKILKTDVSRDKRCLACHTGFPVNHMPMDDGDESNLLVSKKIEENLEIKNGVTCEGCHGPSRDLKSEGKLLLEGWNKAHQEPPAPPYEKTQPWRFLAPETKRKQYGFWDVRSPSSKAKICASCHIGSVAHGRVVTHEMYAAGHPPLPGFEVETFVEQMPIHWNRLTDKSDYVRDQFLKYTNDPIYRSYKNEDLHRARSLLVGAMVATSEYFTLMADLAEGKVKGPVPTPEWPELAVFDCYACHHELKGPSWRQVRKPPAGVPGRPYLQHWNSALLPLALERIEGASKEYDSKFDGIRKALNKQPFGIREDLTKSARGAAEWLWTLAQEFERKPIPDAAGIDLLKRISNQAAGEFLDYDSARQMVWAYQMVEKDAKKTRSEDVSALLNPMEKMFLLDLKKGHPTSVTIPGEKMDRKIVEVDLKVVLPYFGTYDPVRLKTGFLEIGKAIK